MFPIADYFITLLEYSLFRYPVFFFRDSYKISKKFHLWNVQIQTILTPAQENVRDITNQLDSFTETLVQLQHKASQNQLLAADAQQQATEAHAQAKTTQQV